MKVIYLKSFQGVAPGAIKEVADGYARNFLLPHGYVKPATEKAVADLQSKKQYKERAEQGERDRATSIAGKVKGKIFEIKAKATEAGDNLYAAISNDQVRQAIAQKGIDIGAARVLFDKPVKQVGEHTVTVDFGNNVKQEIKLNIIKE